MIIFLVELIQIKECLKQKEDNEEFFKSSKSYPSEMIYDILTASVCTAISSGDDSELKDTGRVISSDKYKPYNDVEQKLRYI